MLCLDLKYKFLGHLSRLYMCFCQELLHHSANLMGFSLETYKQNKYMEYSKIYSLPPFYSAHLGSTFLHTSWTVHNIRLLLGNISGNCFSVLSVHIEVFLPSPKALSDICYFHFCHVINITHFVYQACLIQASFPFIVALPLQKQLNAILNSYILLLKYLCQSGTLVHRTYLSFL